MLNKNVAKLKLPKSVSRLHNSFNVDVLRHVVESPAEFLSRPLPKVSPVHFSPDNDDGDLHVIEPLVKQRTRRRKRQYLVHCRFKIGLGRPGVMLHHSTHFSSTPLIDYPLLCG
ncbi:hypothetical protein PF008_g13337 [Phytophthora fragariae]|uniref:Uncharacterized protein n=2 Tax=Phytophthora fragariae TaxID=53985 RepID=A0A6G0RKR4_9STRA|nr:hypothetical protein PF008_g13337 [Phytophthora fragariae]